MNMFTRTVMNHETADNLIDIVKTMVDESPYLDRVSIDKFTSDAKWLSTRLTGSAVKNLSHTHIYSRFSINSFIETYREALYHEFNLLLPMNLDFFAPKNTVSRNPTEKIEFIERVLKQYSYYIFVAYPSDIDVNRALRLLVTMSTATAFGRMTADESITLMRITHNYIVKSMNDGTFPGTVKESSEDNMSGMMPFRPKESRNKTAPPRSEKLLSGLTPFRPNDPRNEVAPKIKQTLASLIDADETDIPSLIEALTGDDMMSLISVLTTILDKEDEAQKKRGEK